MDKLVASLFLLFFVLSVRDIYQSVGHAAEPAGETDFQSGIRKKIPESNLNKISTAPTITIRYW